jgi:uncharacterized protein YndB with AHSA1/START domain
MPSREALVISRAHFAIFKTSKESIMFSLTNLAARFRRVSQLLNSYQGIRRRLKLAGFALLMASTVASIGLAQATTGDQVDQDLAARSSEIHWPGSPNPNNADVFSHNEIMIDAPCRTVWDHLVNAKAWPLWYPNSHDVNIVGNDQLLGAHTTFGWTTFGVHIDSTIAEFVPGSRLSWFGKGPRVSAYHTWLLVPMGEACHVVTEEATKGAAAAASRRSTPNGLHDGHELWLQRLKKLSEGKVSQEPSLERGPAPKFLSRPEAKGGSLTDSRDFRLDLAARF